MPPGQPPKRKSPILSNLSCFPWGRCRDWRLCGLEDRGRPRNCHLCNPPSHNNAVFIASEEHYIFLCPHTTNSLFVPLQKALNRHLQLLRMPPVTSLLPHEQLSLFGPPPPMGHQQNQSRNMDLYDNPILRSPRHQPLTHSPKIPTAPTNTSYTTSNSSSSPPFIQIYHRTAIELAPQT